jgi:hypothetical protein
MIINPSRNLLLQNEATGAFQGKMGCMLAPRVPTTVREGARATQATAWFGLKNSLHHNKYGKNTRDL